MIHTSVTIKKKSKQQFIDYCFENDIDFQFGCDIFDKILYDIQGTPEQIIKLNEFIKQLNESINIK